MVRKLDNAIDFMNLCPVDTAQLVSLILIRWIVINPMSSEINRLNNWVPWVLPIFSVFENYMWCVESNLYV